MNKKRLILAGVAVCAVVLMTVGATVAFFSYVRQGTQEHTISSGTIKFKYTEKSRGLSITDAMPMTDEEGTTQETYFDFTITSTTRENINIPYTVTVKRINNDSTLDNVVDFNIKEVSYNNNVESVSNVGVVDYQGIQKYKDMTSYSGSTVEKIVYDDVVPANTANYSKTFRLRMWVDKDADYYANGTYPLNNKTFTAQVNVYANGATGTAYSANNVAYVNNLSTRCTQPEDQTVTCALDELSDLLGD